MERYSLSKGADSDKAAKARLKGIDKQLKQLKDEQKVGCPPAGFFPQRLANRLV